VSGVFLFGWVNFFPLAVPPLPALLISIDQPNVSCAGYDGVCLPRPPTSSYIVRYFHEPFPVATRSVPHINLMLLIGLLDLIFSAKGRNVPLTAFELPRPSILFSPTSVSEKFLRFLFPCLILGPFGVLRMPERVFGSF